MPHSLTIIRPQMLLRKLRRFVFILGYISVIYLTFSIVRDVLNTNNQDKSREALQHNESKRKDWTDYKRSKQAVLTNRTEISSSRITTVKASNMNSESKKKDSKVSQINERKKKDWTDYKFVEAEKLRKGPGEHGEPIELTNETEIEISRKIIDEYAHDGLVSDKISLDRAIPDTRHVNCFNRTYYADLPSVSIVIAFRDEYLSPLLRTLHSIINRTPKKLLTEIVLVDDFSTKDFLKSKLDEYIQNYHPDVIRIVRLTEQHGLSKARMAGINASISDIVVILDAHVEVNTNWLPPLIEPIIDDYQTITEPVVYYINSYSYGIQNTTQNGQREIFEWGLTLNWMARDLGNDPSANFENPTILGGLMAVNKTFFWELEGYDQGLDVWGGEQWDLSFKVWRCSEGRLLTIPCSQVGHNFKSADTHPFYSYNTKDPYLIRNLNRIADIWFDEPYKSFFQKEFRLEWQDKGVGKNIEAMHEYRTRKNCKSFQWYLDNIYPELLQKDPIEWDEKPAYGQIESLKHKGKCIDSFKAQENIGLATCYKENGTIPFNQYYLYTVHHEIRGDKYYWLCWDVYALRKSWSKSVNLADCTHMGGNQDFTFDLNNRTIKRISLNHCLAVKTHETFFTLYLLFEHCNGSLEQQWKWTHENKTLIEKLYSTNHTLLRNRLIHPTPLNRKTAI